MAPELLGQSTANNSVWVCYCPSRVREAELTQATQGTDGRCPHRGIGIVKEARRRGDVTNMAGDCGGATARDAVG
jgi:hypothetical protein